MAAQGLSSALKLTDLDDFITPSQVRNISNLEQSQLLHLHDLCVRIVIGMGLVMTKFSNVVASLFACIKSTIQTN